MKTEHIILGLIGLLFILYEILKPKTSTATTTGGSKIGMQTG
jgi:hypothetical protein